MRCEKRCQDRSPARACTDSLGVSPGHRDYVVALAGNPNTGKSTVFNALTGLKQHTGNWPGKTIARAEGAFVHRGRRYRLVDLPGTYSLLSASAEEDVARDYILFGRPDCTIVVVDATSLERNLNLVLQVMEITPRVVVCVNLLDEARRKCVRVDVAGLAERLGVPAVGTSARRGEGMGQLTQAVADLIGGRIPSVPKLPPTPADLRHAVERILPIVTALAPGLPNARWVAYRLLEDDQRIRQALESGELAGLAQQLEVEPTQDAGR